MQTDEPVEASYGLTKTATLTMLRHLGVDVGNRQQLRASWGVGRRANKGAR